VASKRKDVKEAIADTASDLAKKRSEAVSSISSKIFKPMSKGAASDVVDVLPSGIEVLDWHVLGCGGWPIRRVVEVFGENSSGKTSLTCAALASAQRHGGMAMLIEIEDALDTERVEALGVNLDTCFLAEPDSIEAVLSGMKDGLNLIPEGQTNNLLALDSLAMSSLEDVINKGVTAGGMGGARKAALMSEQFPPIVKLARKKNCCLIIVNQQRCVTSDELVVTDGGVMPASEATKRLRIAGMDGRLTPISAHDAQVQAAVRVDTRNGQSLSAGKLHPLLVLTPAGKQAWVEAGEIEVGDWVALADSVELPTLPNAKLPGLPPPRDKRQIDVPTPSEATTELCEFLGMWFADGSLVDGWPSGDRTLDFTERSAERKALVIAGAAKLGWRARPRGAYGLGLTSRVFEFLRALGCQSGAENKTVPACVNGREQWRAFLRAMFDSHPCDRGLVLSVNEKSRKLVQVALQGFGIHTTTNKKRNGLLVSGVDAETYLREIGFLEASKAEAVRRTIGAADYSARGKADVIPHPGGFIAEAMETEGWRALDTALKGRVRTVKSANLNLARRDYITVARACGLDGSAGLRRWTQVVAVVDLGLRATIDFSVPDGEAFIAGGLVTHNTKPGVTFGSPITTPGGETHKFATSIRLQMWPGEKVERKGARIGQDAKIRAIKNKLAEPHHKCEARFLYGEGWDDVWSTINYAKDLKLLEEGAKVSAANYQLAREKLGWAAKRPVPYNSLTPV
jgi:RecA/RadA recombinase